VVDHAITKTATDQRINKRFSRTASAHLAKFLIDLM